MLTMLHIEFQRQLEFVILLMDKVYPFSFVVDCI